MIEPLLMDASYLQAIRRRASDDPDVTLNVNALLAHIAAQEQLIAELEKRPLRTFDQLGADRLADEVAVLVRRRVIDARSPAGDALIDYRESPSTPRADRMAQLEGACVAARYQLLWASGCVADETHRRNIGRAVSLCDLALADNKEGT